MKSRHCPIFFHDVEWECWFDYRPPQKGSRFKAGGDPGDPPLDDELEINWIIHESGILIEATDMSKRLLDDLEQQVRDRVFEEAT
jgi:hypothetical protein